MAVAATVGKEHGRIETRRIETSAEVVPHLAWPGAAQVARIERTRRVGGKTSIEIAYVITSLPRAEATPARLLELTRRHWSVENRLHHVRDMAFAEDRCRVRAGARALATMRNLTIHLVRRTGIPIPEARENFREDRARAIEFVTTRIL